MSTPLVVLTAEQLTELVRGAVCEVLAAQRDDPTPALLDRAGLARALGVSTSMVDRLRREGLPALLMGDSPRFQLTACLEWLQQREHTKHTVAVSRHHPIVEDDHRSDALGRSRKTR